MIFAAYEPKLPLLRILHITSPSPDPRCRIGDRSPLICWRLQMQKILSVSNPDPAREDPEAADCWRRGEATSSNHVQRLLPSRPEERAGFRPATSSRVSDL